MRFSNQITKLSFVAVAALAIASLPSHAFAAALNSNAPSVTLTATLGESLSVSITGSGPSVTLVSGGTSAASSAVPVTTSWVLTPGRTSVKLYGYMSSATAALTDTNTPPDNIPSADVLVEGGTVSSYTAFSQTNAGFGTGATSLLLDTIAISNTNLVSNKADNFTFEVTTPAADPAGTYTGTVTFQAQAN